MSEETVTGFYRYECLITGIGIQSSTAVLVLLQEIDDKYLPIALPLIKQYPNGSEITGKIVEDANASLILKFFRSKLEASEFVIRSWMEYDPELLPLEDINTLTNACGSYEDERELDARLNDEPIYLAVFSQEIWDAILQDAHPMTGAIAPIFDRLFQNTPVAAEIYGESLESVSEQILQLATAHNYLQSLQWEWYPCEENSFRYDLGDEKHVEELLNSLRKAENTFNFQVAPAIFRVITKAKAKLLRNLYPYPLTKPVREAELTPNLEMQALLDRLDCWLAVNRPDYYAHLKPGVTDAELDAFEEQFLLLLPVEFRQLYRWRNGQEEYYFHSLYGNREFMSLESIASTKKIMDDMVGYDFDRPEWWRFEWVPFLTNGGGSDLCLDTQSGGLVQFWKADEDRPSQQSSILEWLAELVTALESRTVEDFYA